MAEEYVDAIKEGQIVTMPLSQAHKEDLFVLRKKIAVEPAPAPPRQGSVIHSRHRVAQEISRPVSKWHSYQPDYKKNNVGKELIDNFHWEIIKGRKLKNLSRKQLADAIGESESSIKMIENAELPSDDFVLINSIQNYLGINLRRDGKTFEMPREPPKPRYSKDVTLSDLQKLKESKEKDERPDIEIIE